MKTVEQGGVPSGQGLTGDEIKAKAKASIDKAKRESLEGKLKGLFQKQAEAQKSVNLITDEINAEVAAYEASLS